MVAPCSWGRLGAVTDTAAAPDDALVKPKKGDTVDALVMGYVDPPVMVKVSGPAVTAIVTLLVSAFCVIVTTLGVIAAFMPVWIAAIRAAVEYIPSGSTKETRPATVNVAWNVLLPAAALMFGLVFGMLTHTTWASTICPSLGSFPRFVCQLLAVPDWRSWLEHLYIFRR